MDFEAAYRDAEARCAKLERETRSLHFCRLLIDFSPDPMLVLDRACTFRFANRRYAEIVGLSVDAIVGSHVRELVGEAFFAEIEPLLDRAFAGEDIAFEQWYSFPSIGLRYFDMRYFPLQAKGHVRHVAILLHDITERREVEERLHDSEARFRAFSDATTEGILLHEHGRIVDCNAAFLEHVGYTAPELIGHYVLEVVAPESRAEIQARFEAGDPGPYEAVSLHKDGSKTIGEIRARDIVYHNHPLRVVAVHDITALRQTEARLRIAVKRTAEWGAELDATIDAIPDGYIVYNPDGTIRRINEMARKLFGFEEADFTLPYTSRMARLRLETFAGEALTLEQVPSYRALHGEVVRGALLVVHRDGYATWLSVSAAPIRINEELTGVVMEYTDVSSLHELQEQQQLYLHMISHDLRSPLTIIHSHAQLLREEAAADSNVHTSVDAILRSAQRMNTMIQDLVDIARLEGRQFELHPQAVALDAYLPDLFARLSPVLDVTRITVKLSPALPPVWADYDRLERILTNLLSNALKYSDPGTPVELRARSLDGKVEVSVEDHGHGIDAQALPHLFERFYRAREVRGGGIGLGLYITRLLVQAHGGDICVDSVEGQGTTFVFTLPTA